MTPREAFKVGFLTRCAVAGLSREETAHAVKTALDKLAIEIPVLSDLSRAAGRAASGIANTAFTYGVPLALAGPPILGGLAGYGLARATDIGDTDVADIKDREVRDEYQRSTEQLKRQRAVRDYLAARKQQGRGI